MRRQDLILARALTLGIMTGQRLTIPVPPKICKVTNVDSALSDYNDEAIGITIVPATAGTLKLDSPSYTFPSITKPNDLTVDYTDGNSLQEMVDIGLPGRITLVYEDASVGTHTIEIWDATANADFPLGVERDENRPREIITFTIHVTPDTTDIVSGDDIDPDSHRVRGEDDVQPVSAHFVFPMTMVSLKI